MVNLYELKPGDRVRTVDGAVVEIAAETEDGAWILARYVEAKDDGLIGTEDLCHEGELREVLPRS